MAKELAVKVDVQTALAVANVTALNREVGTSSLMLGTMATNAGSASTALRGLGATLLGLGGGYLTLQSVVASVRELANQTERVQSARDRVATQATGPEQEIEVLQTQARLKSFSDAQRFMFQIQHRSGVRDPSVVTSIGAAVESSIGFGVDPQLARAAALSVAPLAGRFGLSDEAITNVIRSLASTSDDPRELRANLGKQFAAARGARSADLPAFLRELGATIPIIQGVPGGLEEEAAQSSFVLQQGLFAGLREAQAQTMARQLLRFLGRPKTLDVLEQRFPGANIRGMSALDRVFPIARLMAPLSIDDQRRMLEKEFVAPQEVIEQLPKAMAERGITGALRLERMVRGAGEPELEEIESQIFGSRRFTETQMIGIEKFKGQLFGDRFRTEAANREAGDLAAERISADLTALEGVFVGRKESALIGRWESFATSALAAGPQFLDLAKKAQSNALSLRRMAKFGFEDVRMIEEHKKLSAFAVEFDKRRGFKSPPIPTTEEAIARATEFGDLALAGQLREAQEQVDADIARVEEIRAQGPPGPMRQELLDPMFRRRMAVNRRTLEELRILGSFPEPFTIEPDDGLAEEVNRRINEFQPAAPAVPMRARIIDRSPEGIRTARAVLQNRKALSAIRQKQKLGTLTTNENLLMEILIAESEVLKDESEGVVSFSEPKPMVVNNVGLQQKFEVGGESTGPQEGDLEP